MEKIKVLSKKVIDKIAAGEVIENPASVVKELVDNAIDAGATQLTLEIRGGGFQLIRVVDNGTGMGVEDAVLCFKKYATSKISQIDDLEKLYSMGFRGEALASIAAIAKVELTTALQGRAATQVKVEGGELLSFSSAARQRGSSIDVRSLFYNVPARKRFQRSPLTSYVNILKLLEVMSLAYPEVGWEFFSNGEVISSLPPAVHMDFLEALRQRMVRCFEDRLFTPTLKFYYRDKGYTLQGFLATPQEHRRNRTGQYLFVNRRPIISNKVCQAIKEGFGHRLGIDRYPLFILHLEAPPHLIDVNVHPQKKEIRFQEEELLCSLIKRWVQAYFSPGILNPSPVSFPMERSKEALRMKFREEERQEELVVTEPVIGLFRHYLLIDGALRPEPGIVIADLKKLQEELLWSTLNNVEERLPSQGLLFPIPFEFAKEEALLEREEELQKMGFSLQRVGRQQFVIESVPSFVHEKDLLEVMELITHSQDPFVKISREIVRFSLRRKTLFSLEEALVLWNHFKKALFSEGIKIIRVDDLEKFFLKKTGSIA